MKFPSDWDKITCVDFLQRKILLNSIIYYTLDTNLISDKEFDTEAKQLVSLQSEVDIEKTQYGYVFYDFDGTTGFHLQGRLNEHDEDRLKHIAYTMIKGHTKGMKNDKRKVQNN